ncbi:MAG TPA: hypothetical protein DCL80_09495 [Balneola sp.]|nr:hypothetical protein [Balneola sp.]MAO77958.1 hypothetical protein [Balneola sp.]MBF65251.1 hypothetical protein [Balneola sp.]HAH51473.1 hypothetical protein [Balneola sp.]HBZ40098.1 hypothetical protein [Balneola sp.]
MNRKEFIQNCIAGLATIGLMPTKYFTDRILDYDEFQNRWDLFIDTPTQENALYLYNIIPSYNFFEREKQLRVTSRIDCDLHTLDNYIQANNYYAVKASFGLYAIIVNGSVCSSLNIINGKYLHVNPENFLNELKNHRHLIRFSKILGNYGLDFVDRFKAQNVETKKRIISLESVSNERLALIQSECIAILKEKIITNPAILRQSID